MLKAFLVCGRAAQSASCLWACRIDMAPKVIKRPAAASGSVKRPAAARERSTTEWQWPTGYHTLIRCNCELDLFEFRNADGSVDTYAAGVEALRRCPAPFIKPNSVREVFKLTLRAPSGDRTEDNDGHHANIRSARFVGYQPVLALPPGCRS